MRKNFKKEEKVTDSKMKTRDLVKRKIQSNRKTSGFSFYRERGNIVSAMGLIGKRI